MYALQNGVSGTEIKLLLKLPQRKKVLQKLRFIPKIIQKSTAKTINVKVNSNNSHVQDVEPEEEIIAFGDSFIVYWGGDSFDNNDQNNSETTTDKNDVSDNTSSTEKVIELVNKERAAVGASALVSDPKLNEVAALRAKEIAESFSHTRPDGSSCFTAFNEAGIVNVHMGENIAAGQRSASEVMKDWMNSQGHKENILDPEFTRIGVGFFKASGGYGYYWVQVFTSDYKEIDD